MQLAPTLQAPPQPEIEAYISRNGTDLFKQLGATDVSLDGNTLRLTYTNNSDAVNADALLKDTFLGAQLIIDNRSMTRDMPAVSSHGIKSVLDGVRGLLTTLTVPAPGQGGNAVVNAVTADAGLASTLGQLMNSNPAPGLEVQVALVGCIG